MGSNPPFTGLSLAHGSHTMCVSGSIGLKQTVRQHCTFSCENKLILRNTQNVPFKIIQYIILQSCKTAHSGSKDQHVDNIIVTYHTH